MRGTLPSAFFYTFEVQFVVPNWRNKVDYSIGLSYRPARLHRLAAQHDNPIWQSPLNPPSQGLRIWLLLFWSPSSSVFVKIIYRKTKF